MLVGLLVMYPLSYGPANWLYYHYSDAVPNAALRLAHVIYIPHSWLGVAYDWYRDTHKCYMNRFGLPDVL